MPPKSDDSSESGIDRHAVEPTKTQRGDRVEKSKEKFEGNWANSVSTLNVPSNRGEIRHAAALVDRLHTERGALSVSRF